MVLLLPVLSLRILPGGFAQYTIITPEKVSGASIVVYPVTHPCHNRFCKHCGMHWLNCLTNPRTKNDRSMQKAIFTRSFRSEYYISFIRSCVDTLYNRFEWAF